MVGRDIVSFAATVALVATGLLPTPLLAGRASETPFMRGVIVSCPRAGQIWGTEAMSDALGEITDLGADWVSIHPYAWTAVDGSLRFTPAADTGYLKDAVDRMRTAGVRVFWKPHLGYWGSFEWRGAIAFGDDEPAWQRFFEHYRRFIVDQARFAQAHDIELFSVGIEYEKTMHREADWRRVIAAVREVYDGPITYAANWDGLHRVPFWDAIDLIGVHAYFPLAGDEATTREAISDAWQAHFVELRELSSAYDRQVVFAEIGYNRHPEAARAPWTYGSVDSTQNRLLREMLMDIALEAVEAQPFIAGMFWWKWMPGGRSGRDFSLKEDEARRSLRRHWAGRRGGVADAPAAAPSPGRR